MRPWKDLQKHWTASGRILWIRLRRRNLFGPVWRANPKDSLAASRDPLLVELLCGSCCSGAVVLFARWQRIRWGAGGKGCVPGQTVAGCT